MKFEKIGIITFIGKVTGVRYIGLFSDSDKMLQAVNYHTGKFNDYVCYNNEPIYEANEEQKQFLFDALAKENKYYCEKTKTIKEMKKEKGTKCTDWENSSCFTKKDLKSGMWVELRNGSKHLVLTNCIDGTDFYIINNSDWDYSENYNDDLSSVSFESLDIIKVFSDEIRQSTLKGSNTLIWERETEEDKQMKEMRIKLEEMKKAYNELEKNISETIEKLNNIKK